MLDKRTQNSTVNKEGTIINLKNTLQETHGCCSVASCWLFCSAYSSPYFFFKYFLKGQTVAQYTARPPPVGAGGRGKQQCLALHWQPPRREDGNPQGRRVPCRLHQELKNMLMSSQREPPGLVTSPLSLPFKAAGRSSVKVQAHVRVCSRHCLQFAPACAEPLPPQSHQCPQVT